MQAFIASRLTVSATVKTRGGGLAPWQQRCATELLLAGIGRHVPVADLASACGLSESHFVRAFRQSTGLPPHQWVLARRIERSKELLSRSPSQSLSEVAIACGFADQSHFTRTFPRMAGLTPGAWRRFAAATRDSDAEVRTTMAARPYARGLPRGSVSPQSGLGEAAMSTFRHVSNRAVEAIDHLDAQIRRLPARWLLAYVALAAILAIAAACDALDTRDACHFKRSWAGFHSRQTAGCKPCLGLGECRC